jgi:hypothetical protein
MISNEIKYPILYKMFRAYKNKALTWNLDYGRISFWYSIKSENKLKKNVTCVFLIFRLFYAFFSRIFIIGI